MIEMKTSIISPKVSLRANPIHDDQTPGSHGDVDSYCRTVHAAGNSAITPLQDDLAAIQAGLTLPWSNGVTEGHVNRLKLFKRQAYGRAHVALLRQRMLQES
jgi:hypothetical protein